MHYSSATSSDNDGATMAAPRDEQKKFYSLLTIPPSHLSNRKRHCLISVQNVVPFRISWDGAGDGGETVAVKDGLFAVQELRQVLLQPKMNIHRSVEAARSAGTNAVVAQRVHGCFLDAFIADKVEVVEGSQIEAPFHYTT